jgi:hypothetical protein
MDLNINLKSMHILVSLLLLTINLFSKENKVSLEKLYLKQMKKSIYLM